MAAQKPARAWPELRVAPLSPRYRRNYTTSGDTTFKSVHRFLSAILRDAKVSDDSLPEYFDAIQKSRFLFGTEIQEYLKLINSRAQDMRLFQIKLKDLPVGQERSELCEKESDELKWLTNQIEEIFNRFEPYLGFERHQ